MNKPVRVTEAIPNIVTDHVVQNLQLSQPLLVFPKDWIMKGTTLVSAVAFRMSADMFVEPFVVNVCRNLVAMRAKSLLNARHSGLKAESNVCLLVGVGAVIQMCEPARMKRFVFLSYGHDQNLATSLAHVMTSHVVIEPPNLHVTRVSSCACVG